MRKAWIKFGSMVFLDAMKRKMNSLHWPYIGPVAMDLWLWIMKCVWFSYASVCVLEKHSGPTNLHSNHWNLWSLADC